MEIKALPQTVDPQGQPAIKYTYYIGKPFQDPENPENQLKIFDGEGGPQTSNPIYIDKYGRFVNDNSQPITPWINEESYSQRILDQIGNEFDYKPKVTSDNISKTDAGNGIADATVNNLNDTDSGARFLELGEFNTVYIESLESGWEGTVDGPIGGFLAHKDDTTGEPSTGDQNKFFDASGNGLVRNQAQMLKPDGVTIQVDTATNEISTTLPIAGFFNGFDYGPTLGQEDSAVSIQAGTCADSTGTAIIKLDTTTQANIKNGISEGGNRAGGLLANTTYYIYVVSEDNGLNPRIAFDDSTTASQALSDWSAEIPGSNYTKYRLIGFALTDGNADIVPHRCRGNLFTLSAQVQAYETSGPPTTAVDFTLDGLPDNVEVEPIADFAIRNANTVNSTFILISETSQADLIPSETLYTFSNRNTGTSGSSNERIDGNVKIVGFMTNTARQLRYRFSQAEGQEINVTLSAWKYNR